MSSSVTQARPYARGAYQEAKSSGDIAKWSSALAQLAGLVCTPDIWDIVKDPMVKKDQVVSLLMDAAGLKQAEIENFLSLLAQYHRLALLPDIHTLFIALQHEDEKILDAEFIAPFAASDETLSMIKEKLELRFKRKVHLTTRVDNTLIGGGMVRIGDEVIDGTLKSKLNDLSKHILTN